MAAMGPEDRAGPGPGPRPGPGGDLPQTLVFTQRSVPAEKASVESRLHANATTTTGPTMHLGSTSGTREAPYSFRSPESVEMDEIMAAMVLTSLSCSPVIQIPPQTDPGLAGLSSSADMECGGGELSDSGSSGYWSWDHGNVSPAPSPPVTEMDSSPDEGLQMELDQGDELNAKKPKSCFRGVYRCLWPSCGKLLTSSVGIKRHVRVLHLCSVSDQSHREEDFYYTRVSCETGDPGSSPAPPQQAPGQASSSPLSWACCGSPPPPHPPASGLQIPLAHRPRSNSSSGPGPSRPSPLSQSAPSSFWQIHSEHLYQACSPVQVSVAPRSPGCQGWTPSASSPSTTPVGNAPVGNTPVVKPRCRSVSVGEQWLQQNRLQPMSASPSRSHCSFRKGRGEAKKCRKVYGVERKDQWCTACRWKKACQRFPD